MNDEDGPKNPTPGSPEWAELMRRILGDSEALQKQHEAALAMANQMARSVDLARIREGVMATQKLLDVSGIRAAMRWYTQNSRVIDQVTEMVSRSYPAIEAHLRLLGASYPAPPQTAPANVEEVLSALEQARSDVGEQPASQLEAFLERDTDLEEDVTGLASLLNLRDPEVQARIKTIIRWVINLAVVAFIAGDFALAGALSSILGLFGLSVKDGQKIIENAVQKVMDKRTAHADDDEET